MSEGITCYERDETLCKDPMCSRVGCRLRNERLARSSTGSDYTALPCPFCGSKPVVAAAGYATIHCADADCFGPRTTAQYLTDALAQWNKRSGDAAQASPERGDYDHGYADGVEWATKEVEQRSDQLLSKISRELDAQPTHGGDKGEAVAWQKRPKFGENRKWSELVGDDAEGRQWWIEQDYELRALFAAPQPASNETEDLRRANEILHALLSGRDAEIERLRGDAYAEQLPCPADTPEGREEVARMIYNAFPYDGPLGKQKPDWIPNGNSFHQDKARSTADDIICALRPATYSVPSTDREGK